MTYISLHDKQLQDARAVSMQSSGRWKREDEDLAREAGGARPRVPCRKTAKRTEAALDGAAPGSQAKRRRRGECSPLDASYLALPPRRAPTPPPIDEGSEPEAEPMTADHLARAMVRHAAAHSFAFAQVLYGRVVEYQQYCRQAVISAAVVLKKPAFDAVVQAVLRVVLVVNDEGCAKVLALSESKRAFLAEIHSLEHFPMYLSPLLSVQYDTCWSNVGYTSPYGTSHLACSLTNGVLARHHFSKQSFELAHACITSGFAKSAGAMDPTGLVECILKLDEMMTAAEIARDVAVTCDGDGKSDAIFKECSGGLHLSSNPARCPCSKFITPLYLIKQAPPPTAIARGGRGRGAGSGRGQGRGRGRGLGAQAEPSISGIYPRLASLSRGFVKRRCRTHQAKNLVKWCTTHLSKIDCLCVDENGHSLKRKAGHRFVDHCGVAQKLSGGFHMKMAGAQEQYILKEPKSYHQAIEYYRAHSGDRPAATDEFQRGLYHLANHYSGTYATPYGEEKEEPLLLKGGEVEGFVLLSASDLYTTEPVRPIVPSVFDPDFIGPCLPKEHSTGDAGPIKEFKGFRDKPARFYCQDQAHAMQEYMQSNIIPALPALLSEIGGTDVNTAESHHGQWIYFRPKNICYTPWGQVLLVELGIAHSNHLTLQAHGIDWNPYERANELLRARFGEVACLPASCIEASRKYIAERVVMQTHRSKAEVKERRNSDRFNIRTKKSKETKEGKESYETQAEIRTEPAPGQAT